MNNRSSFAAAIFFIAAAVLVAACTRTPPVDPAAVAAHLAEVRSWQQARDTRLRDPTGWLTLAGLHWLKPGDNTVGSDPLAAVILPKPAPARLGQITLDGDVATLSVAQGSGVTVDGVGITRQQMRSDAAGPPTVAMIGKIRFFVIARAGRFAVRVKDEASPVLAAFHRIERFDVDYRWRLDGHLERDPRKITVPNILGVETRESSPGSLVFSLSHGGASFRLVALGDAEDDEMFVIFADRSNGEVTYGGGRFLDVAWPVAGSDAIVIDFNRAYNPPCAFTPYATCPLPPKGNRLSFAVVAGEKKYGDH